MKKVYIAAAKRSAIGSFNGTLSAVPAAAFAATVAKGVIRDAGIDPGSISEVLVGNILPAGAGQGPARQVALGAGVPVSVPAYSINMACGSGMKAIANAYAGIQAAHGDLYLAGGTENMSAAPYLLPGARQGLRMGDKQIVDHMVSDALTDAFHNYHMGITAENIAEKHGITREEQDAFAWGSQQKAVAAVDNGAFQAEIEPVTVKLRREERIFDTDEYPNRNTTLEKLASLRPAFQKDGTVTAGNASGINDGAAFLLVASEDAVRKYGLTPMAEVVATGQGGVDPSVMGLGPVPAIADALKRGGLRLSDMDLLELNEAFAAQALGVVRELAAAHDLSREEILARTNLNGGAIALGHPLGASGARIVITLLYLMKARGAALGLASLCIGGGMGTAIVLKNM